MKVENNIIIFNYQGSNIPFALTGNDVMINATEMIKLFPGKRMNNFLRSDQTQELIKQLESETRISASQLVLVVKGNYSDGRSQGTWMHRKIAIAFAMWLSPVFYSWCLGKIDEIINQGYAFRDAEIQRLNGVIQSMQPQVNYYKDILTTSENLYSTEQVCKDLELGISSKTLLSKLESFGFIYRRPDGKWFLSSNLDNLGYIKVITIKDSKTGKPRNLKRWTEEGKHWIWSLKKKL